MMDDVVCQPQELRTFAAEVLRRCGVLPDSADIVANHLVDANLAGVDSHGVIRVPEYCRQIAARTIDPRSRPEIVSSAGAIALVDGAGCFGQLTGNLAARVGVELASLRGIGAVALRGCMHLGRLGAYAEQAAAENVVMLAWVGGIGPPYEAIPFGSVTPTHGSNPIAVGFPRDEAPPVIIDIATTVAAGGRIRYGELLGVPLPEGSLVDRHGQSAVDTSDLGKGGGLLPFGGHKGYGLAIAAELLGSVLTGSSRPSSGAANSASEYSFSDSGALFVCLRADIFAPQDAVALGVAQLAERIRQARPSRPGRASRLPGEGAEESREQRARGIPVPGFVWERLLAAARDAGIPEREFPG